MLGQFKCEAPGFDEPRLVSLVRGGGPTTDDLGDLTHDELMAFASRIRQLADDRVGDYFAKLGKRRPRYH